MNGFKRQVILVIGARPIDLSAFEQRHLTLKRVNIDQLGDIDLLNSACGILLSVPTGKFGLINLYFEEHFYRACELGLMTAIYATENKEQIIAIRNSAYISYKIDEDVTDEEKRKQGFDSLAWVYLNEKEWAIAETFARHDPGPPRGSPTIHQYGMTNSLDAETKVLLKRAFYDCYRISVKQLDGGRTAKGTYCVLANLSKIGYGPQPIPFFVKVGGVKTIETEKYNYQEFVEPFVPFHLHPSLSNMRSVKSLSAAALVGDFVESAVPLRDSLRVGQGGGAIFSLFEITLRGLRSHTLNGPKESGVIEAFLGSKVRAKEIAEKHPSRIAFLRENNMLRSPVEVEQILTNHAKKIQTPQGPYHGDLHFSNVMVRNRDAIVIDFGSMGPFGPLYADPAILEVSLVFGTDDHDDPECFNSWREFVDDIFLKPLTPPLPKGDYPQFAWLHKAIRELRHVVACCGASEAEALIILAGCLLRYGRNSPLKLKSAELDLLAERRRAYGLVVAYQICERLEADYATR